MKWLRIALVAVAVCGCKGHQPAAKADASPDVSPDAMPQPRLCDPSSGGLAEIADGTLLGMDATRLFIANNSSIEAWSKADGTLAVLDVPVGTSASIIVNNVAIATTSSGTSLIATNLDDGTQVMIALAVAEQVESMVAAPNGALFVSTAATIQEVDPGATTARVVVTAAPMTSFLGMAAINDALVWVELDAMGQHLKKLTFSDGSVVVLNEITDYYATATAQSAGKTVIELTGTDVVLVEYGAYEAWSLKRRSAIDGQVVATYDQGGLDQPYELAVDSSNVYWTSPMSLNVGPMMTCSTWPGLHYEALSGGVERATLDESFGDRPLLTDDRRLYFSTGGRTGGCCCGNTVQCNAGFTCTDPDIPGDAPPVVKCYTR